MSSPDDVPTSAEVVIHSDRPHSTEPPSLRLLHYNDVYHVESGSREPVGGIARFQTLCNYYRDDKSFEGQPKPLTFFSGDAFNPSLESSVTKGKHMVPVLNAVGTDVACVGNHDLDFGVPQFRYLASQCKFPWLLANVFDPALGEDIPLGNAQRTVMLTASNGLKVGVIGLVEREWLDTINSLPPNLAYKSVSATAKELCPKLRADGADIVIAVTHQREPNDDKLARNTGSDLVDIILGGHDHFYGHSIINGTHVLRSGTDFKQLSHIKAWKKAGGGTGWDFEIVRRDVVADIPEDKPTLELVEKLTSALKSKLEKPIGYTLAPLDARFTTVRLRESNLGNFVCDLMRLFYQADCSIMAAGTIRGDQIYPPGILKLKDLMNCFPFEDPVVVLSVKGKAIEEALENSVSTYPALEGRFPQVSNIHLQFDPDAPPGARILSIRVGNEPLDHNREYKLATRGYMSRGKDGYDSLLVESDGGSAREIVSEENGVLISTILRQYFMSLKVLGRWKRWGRSMSRHWSTVHGDLHETHPIHESNSAPPSPNPDGTVQQQSLPRQQDGVKHEELDSESENEADLDQPVVRIIPPDMSYSEEENAAAERELVIMRKVLRKWWRLAGLPGHPGMGHEEEGEFDAAWTRGIAPRHEGRIEQVKRTDIHPV